MLHKSSENEGFLCKSNTFEHHYSVELSNALAIKRIIRQVVSMHWAGQYFRSSLLRNYLTVYGFAFTLKYLRGKECHDTSPLLGKSLTLLSYYQMSRNCYL